MHCVPLEVRVRGVSSRLGGGAASQRVFGAHPGPGVPAGASRVKRAGLYLWQ